jgi:hypothetical protein
VIKSKLKSKRNIIIRMPGFENLLVGCLTMSGNRNAILELVFDLLVCLDCSRDH